MHLTMRWSDRPPAASSHFAWLKRLHFGPRALSVAVAHLFLVRPMIARSRLALLFGLVVAFAGCGRAAELRSKYLADPKVSAEIKEAIRKRVVIVGMCPFEVFAAAGMPVGIYEVTPDPKKWRFDIAPPVIIDAQCEKPDDSVIWLTFKNKTQFGTADPVVFHVRFEKGRSVLITRTHKITPGGA